MKLIFLDIDGVLNTSKNYNEWRDRATELRLEDATDPWEDPLVKLLFDETLVGRLNRIVEESGARIVVSSSWRHLYHPHFERLAEHLRLGGVKGEILSCTPIHFSGRWGAIREALKHLQPEAYVILDDYAPPSEFLFYTVQTDGEMGLTEEDVGEAVQILLTTEEETCGPKWDAE